MDQTHIRNFSIIAHIDHGKSTLADRLLEITNTVEKRKMKEQVLDQMELERERGITIKLQPAQMQYKLEGENYTLNLIDTPGHIDFSYEVSRALKAVEGTLLLVDATQGIQAQTLSTLSLAKEQGLVIIPVVTKTDSPLARVDEVKEELATLLDTSKEEVLAVSGKTGEGVEALLEALIKRIPHPEKAEYEEPRGLIFDFSYSNHRGIMVYLRLFDGTIRKGDSISFASSGENFVAQEVGKFAPEPHETDVLAPGEIGYVVTGIKEPGVASVGDTILKKGSSSPALDGYRQPQPVVFVSLYPEKQDDFSDLRTALLRLHLTDSSLTFEEESSGILGKGFRCGLLGMLHLEIVTERLTREFSLSLIVTTPSISYKLVDGGAEQIVYSPTKFPDDRSMEVHEPWVSLIVITPTNSVGEVLQLLREHEGMVEETETLSDGRTKFVGAMPLRELMRNFFDQLKSATKGYASLSYKLGEYMPADVARLELLVAEEVVPAFTKVVAKRRIEIEARRSVERLYELLPRQLFPTKIQARALGRIVASKTLPAMRKDVTGHLYGGDITRKKKLLEKQKKGKKKLAQRGEVSIPQEVFLKMVRDSESK